MLIKAFILNQAPSSLKSATPFKNTAHLRPSEQVQKWIKHYFSQVEISVVTLVKCSNISKNTPGNCSSGNCLVPF